ncbi:MAG: response regulator [Stenomitos rutilans HA7619-LM2]|jgi:hypothetical protein|nr:response regulator [Stenomitos rutilans HA7619-LM2]
MNRPMTECPAPYTLSTVSTATTPEDLQATVQQLATELQAERYLNRLGQRLSACVLASLEVDRELAISGADEPLAQVVVDELNLGLSQSCAMVLRSGDATSHCIAPSAQTLEPCFTVCAIAANHSQAVLGDPSFPTMTALMPFVLGQTLSDRELQSWQAQFPACGWPILDGTAVLGWLLLAPAASDFQSEAMDEMESFTACLNARLIEQSLDRYRSARQQIERIQAQVQQRQTLEVSNCELTQANQLKSEFLANTSHEIRTPLSSILGFTHLMREQGFSPSNLKHQEYLNIILSSGQHLLSLINDILDLSKIEANQLDLHWETVAVQSVCQTAIALVREKANDKGLALKLEIAPQVETLVADPLRLKQMLFNLLSNALKFTRQGSVGLQVTASDAIHFTVWDTGTGISEDQQQLLFRPYSQLLNPAAKRDEGTGLGLALTQKLAELHGGRVEIRSELGQGSRFTIVLPLEPAATDGDTALAELAQPISPYSLTREGHDQGQVSDATVANHAESDGSRANPYPQAEVLSPSDRYMRSNHLLLVEDNAYNAKLLLTYLSKLGYELTWVKDGTEMRQALARALPALILMDIHLPNEDGLALTHQLQTDDRYRTIPIIAQTAMAMNGDRDLCLQAGTVAYISKPIDLKALAKLVGQYVSVC